MSDDLIHGGEGNDTLFGQSPSNVLNGDGGIDSLFGGPGNSNTANAGGDGTGDIGRDGSEEYPRDLELDLLEDYQFNSRSPLVLGLVDDIGNGPDINLNELSFSQILGNFMLNSVEDQSALAAAGGTTELLVMP